MAFFFSFYNLYFVLFFVFVLLFLFFSGYVQEMHIGTNLAISVIVFTESSDIPV